MSFNIYIVCAYAIICAVSAVVTTSVSKKTLPSWATIFTSLVGMVIWSLAVRKSTWSLVRLSAMFDIVGCLSYFVGFTICGEVVTSTQWVGILLMTVSIYLINK